MLILVTAGALVIAGLAYAALLSTPKDGYSPTRRQTPVRNRRPDLFVPSRGHEGAREGFPRGSRVL